MKSLCVLVIAGLAAPALGITPPIKLGPISGGGGHGSLPEKYENLTKRDVRFGLTARFLLEQFRDVMAKGFDNVPPLDPLNIEDPEPTQFIDQEVRGKIQFSNFTLMGAKTFKLKKLETRLDNGRVDFEFYVPLAYFDVTYNSTVQVDTSHNFFKGYASVGLRDVNVEGAFAVEGTPRDAPPENQKLQVVGFYYHLTSDSVNYNLGDQEYGIPPRLGNSNENEASEVVKVIARKLANVTSQSVVNTLVKAANEILGEYTPVQALWLEKVDIA